MHSMCVFASTMWNRTIDMPKDLIMPHINRTEKQAALEKIRDILRHIGSNQEKPEKSLALELHNILYKLLRQHPETIQSPLIRKAQSQLDELNIKNPQALARKIRRKNNRKSRKAAEAAAAAAAGQGSSKKTKSEDLLDSRLLYKGSFGSGKRR